MLQEPYLVLKQNNEREREGFFKISNIDFIFLLLAFFVGHAQLANFYFLPFVYLTIMAISKRFVFLISFIIISLSFYWSGGFLNFKYLLAVSLGFLTYLLFRQKLKKLDIVWINTLLYIIFAFINNYIYEHLTIFYFIYIAEAILIYGITHLSIKGFRQIINKKEHLSNLALFTIFIFSNGFLIGIANFDFIPYQVINILIMTLIMAMSYILGFNYSIITALAFGMVLHGADIIPLNNLFLYIIFAFISSAFLNKKKIWSLLGVVIVFFLYSGFSTDISELQEIALVLLLVFIIFMIVPQKFYYRLFSPFLVKEKVTIKEEKFELVTDLKEHLKQLSGVFSELSITFSQAIPTDSGDKSLDDFAFIFKSKVCGKCKRLNICWQQEKDDIYKRIYFLLKTGEKEGSLSVENINKCFAEKCSYVKQIISSAKVSYEIYQINKFWRNRLKDNQKIVSEQLSGLAEIVNQFSGGSSLTTIKEAVLGHIKRKATENGIDLYKVELHSIGDNREYLTAEMEQCSGNNVCGEQFLDLINAEFDCDFRLVSKSCGNKMKDMACRLVYGPLGNYKLEVASVLRACSDNTSGDGFLHKALKDGKDLVVISDGMGVGKKAAAESEAAINLLETIIDAGFDQSLAIKTINSALYLRNQEETFTTLDICIFDTFTGKVTFSKIGAIASYIKRGWELIKIDSASLPVGILDKIEVTKNELEVYPDDFIIMLTDGVMDIRDDIKDKEEWLRQMMQNSSFDQADSMLNYMLETILDFNGEINDDMTMVVIKVEELIKKSRKFKGLPRINIGK
ncbi:SpoIIE family protein phosphatase [Natronospora cellulosivora (SeqCode)]